jgi:RecJ-like exonuclease
MTDPAFPDPQPDDTSSAGENSCPACGGTGRLDARACPECDGTGKVMDGIGGG